MNTYYLDRLAGARLQRAYDVAPPRVQRHLEAEIQFVLQRVQPGDLVLELGCGYGRVLRRLQEKAGTVVGIDVSAASLQLARSYIRHSPCCHLFKMNATRLGFADRQFDAVVCVENGISSFRVNKRKLVGEALRVTRPGGVVLFSTYSARFWDERLEWFRIQAQHGLIGRIDAEATGNGTVVCGDGFRSGVVRPEDFVFLTAHFNLVPRITEVDGSSLFFELRVPTYLRKSADTMVPAHSAGTSAPPRISELSP
jgi:2-polyprenyl-6-hydroxyphenyl methylase/3-demethylubiquinone-9 3-methyltransferase